VSELAEHLRPIYAEIQVPRDSAGVHVDTGEWQRAGVTHWHLYRSEWDLADPARFDTRRLAHQPRTAPDEVARSPHAVLEWMRAHAPKSDYADDLTFWRAARGQDVHRLRRISSRRITHLDAHAIRGRGFTAAECCR